jgi:hypothetical protein
MKYLKNSMKRQLFWIQFPTPMRRDHRLRHKEPRHSSACDLKNASLLGNQYVQCDGISETHTNRILSVQKTDIGL